MKKYRSVLPGKTWSTLSNELRALVELNQREHEKMFILVGKRGISSSTVCNDCGTVVSCKKCGAPLTLHEQKNGRKGKTAFLCRKCGNTRIIEKDGEDHCEKCGSWRLIPLGVGIERVCEDLKKEFPNLSIFRIDSDVTKTEKILQKTISDFYNERSALLVGTEMALPYLNKSVESSAIAGIDSYLAIPDFRINEKIFALILSLRAKTRKTIIMQTQEADRALFEQALKGDLLSFYREEIAERKKFNYPPFAVLIKISWVTKTDRAEKETSEAAAKLEGYSLNAYTSLMSGKKQGLLANILIRIPRGKWVDDKMLTILKKLPPKYVVSVDPDNVF